MAFRLSLRMRIARDISLFVVALLGLTILVLGVRLRSFVGELVLEDNLQIVAAR